MVKLARSSGPLGSLVTVVLLGLVLMETLLIGHYRQLYMAAKYPMSDSSLPTGAGVTHQSSDSILDATGTATSGRQDSAAGMQQSSTQTITTQQGMSGGAAGHGLSFGPAVNGLPSLLLNDVYQQRLLQLEKAPNGTFLRSNKFAPLRVSVCTHRMPGHWAPCLKMPNVDIAHAEEVLYPAHRVRLPGFVNEEDRQKWVGVIATRGLAVKEDRDFVPFHVSGQNFVFRNTRYTDNPFPDNWNGACTHCLGHMGEVAQLQSTTASADDSVHDEIFIANTPQSWSYQHFSDHVFKLVMQGMHLLTNNTEVIASVPGDKNVHEIWSWFTPINYSKIIFGKKPSHFAKKLIHSCRTPFWHPYMVQRWQEMVLGPDAILTPMEQRKYVLYYSRSLPDVRIHNGGRKVLNENQLQSEIQALLQQRGQGEQLKVLKIDDFANYKDLVTWLNQNVRAFVGPHGGGLINCIWNAKDTLMIEFQHEHHVNYAMWELSPLLEQNYHVMIYPTVGGSDMNVNIPDVIKILSENLGKVAPMGTYVDYDYDWIKALQQI